jgi:hypothetical protein
MGVGPPDKGGDALMLISWTRGRKGGGGGVPALPNFNDARSIVLSHMHTGNT